MNIQSLLIAAVALTLGLSACNKEGDLAQQDGIPANAVRITASVGNPFAATRSNPLGTAEEQAKFNNGDEVIVKNTEGDQVVYQFDGTNWIALDNKNHLWKNDVATFSAYYPSSDALASIDQSTPDLITASDLMSAKIENAPKGEVLNFVMERQTSKIIINIAGFNSEFSSDSKVDNVKIVAIDDSYIEAQSWDFIPYPQGDGAEGSTYTLLADKYLSDMYVKLKVGDKQLQSTVLPVMEMGKSYTYNLIVGKEKLELGNVTVEDWTNEEIIPGGQAGERM